MTLDDNFWLHHPFSQPRRPDGTPGLRDEDAPCEFFQVPTNDPGPCEGDGHYLCQECPHLRSTIMLKSPLDGSLTPLDLTQGALNAIPKG